MLGDIGVNAVGVLFGVVVVVGMFWCGCFVLLVGLVGFILVSERVSFIMVIEFILGLCELDVLG